MVEGFYSSARTITEMKSTGYILNGIYYTDMSTRPSEIEGESITYKAYSRDRQREDHRYDLIQPYKDGKPNPEFIEQYPEEAKQYGFN